MQKLNLSALKKQPGSIPVATPLGTTLASSIPPVDALKEVSTQDTISSSQPKSVEQDKITEEEATKEEKKVESTEIKIVEISMKEDKQSEGTHEDNVSSKEFFPNLGVNQNLLDDIFGEKVVEKNEMIPVSSNTTAPIVLKTTSGDKGILGIEKVFENGTTEKKVLASQIEQAKSITDIPLEEDSVDPLEKEVNSHEIAAITQETSVTTSSIDSVNTPKVTGALPITTKDESEVKILAADTVEQVAKDLSAQRIGGLGALFVNKKKVVYATSGLLAIMTTGVVVLDFFQIDNIKSSVIEPPPVLIDVATPVVTATSTGTTSSGGVVENTSTGTIVMTSTGATHSGAVVTSSGATSTGTTSPITPVTSVGSGAAITATGTTLTSIQPQAFSGTRIINFRTPNPPREKK